MTNYISFSLYGEGSFYHKGAIANVKLCSTIYPEWTPIFYVGGGVPELVTSELTSNGALVVEGSDELSKNKKAWRFAAALIEDTEKVIFRDVDSRINPRERACVDSWLKSGKPVHIMRDHPYHANWINAGMWGLEANVGKNYVSKILSIAQGTEVDEDQYLLAKELYWYCRNQTFVHDSFFRREKWAKPFPTPRESSQFVGERIDEEGKPETEMREMLIRYEQSNFLRFQLLAQDWKRTRTQQKLPPKDS
jgi:hypothetical protein